MESAEERPAEEVEERGGGGVKWKTVADRYRAHTTGQQKAT